jgi:hypothetical protein
MAKGIVIYIDGTVETRDFNGLKDYQDAVGGLIEALPLTGGADVYVNEDGKVMCQPNIFATFIMQINRRLNHGDYVAGNMVVIGKPDSEGNDTDAPEWVFDFLQKMNAPEPTIDEVIGEINNATN